MLRIGAAVLAAIILGVGATVLFSNTKLAPTVKVHVHFGHMAGLQEHADVVLAGQVVGRVTALRLIPAGSSKEGHPLHPDGGVTADLRIDLWHAERAAHNGEYFVSSKGLLGKSYIEIGPPANDAPVTRSIESGDDIRGIDPPILDRAVYRAMYNLNVSREFIRELGPEMAQMQDNLAELNANLQAVLPGGDSWDQLIADSGQFSDELGALIDGTGDLSRLNRTVNAGRRLLRRGSTQLTDTQQGIFALRAELDRVGGLVPPDLAPKFKLVKRRLDANLARIERTTAKLNQMLAMLERGEGTLGAIGNDPEFSDDARQLGKILKREPWRLLGHPGNKAPKYGKIKPPPRGLFSPK
ncbi:MAG: MCE family protein [Deltaproteobacteria bacterium]|nr:MCE family protein [Deltaproteobacteria bacterium]